MMAFVMLNGLALVGEAASGVIKGVKKIATAISDVQAKKMLHNIKQYMEEEDEEECRYCGELTTIQEFWGQLPEGEGRYRAC